MAAFGPKAVSWTAMSDGTAADYRMLSERYEDHARTTLADSLLATLSRLAGPTLGYRVDREQHSRQSATRALRNGEPTELVVAALLHDVGDVLAPHNHSAVAADILAPFVSAETEWVIRHHGLFQGYYYFHHLGGDRDARERYASSPHYDRCVWFCAEYDQNCFDPNYDNLEVEAFVPMVEEVLARPSRLGQEWDLAPSETPNGPA
ncbi:MAG: HD domain-containing protein [Actinomycetota bacterium]